MLYDAFLISFLLKNNRNDMNATQFFTDVKSPIMAGMQFCYTKGETKNDIIKQVGYDVVRIYYDSAEKNCVVGEKRLKRVFND